MKTNFLPLLLILIIIFSCEKKHKSCDLQIVSTRQQDIDDIYLSPNYIWHNLKRIHDEKFETYFKQNYSELFDTTNTKEFIFQHEYYTENDSTECVKARIDYSLQMSQIIYEGKKYWMPLDSKSTCYAFDEDISLDIYIDIQTTKFGSNDTIQIYPFIKWGLGLNSNKIRKNKRDILPNLLGPSLQNSLGFYTDSKNDSFYFVTDLKKPDPSDDNFEQKILKAIFNTEEIILKRQTTLLDGKDTEKFPFSRD